MRRRTVQSAAVTVTLGGAPTGPPQSFAENLNVPWSLAFLPGGDALVSERETARILRARQGRDSRLWITTSNRDGRGDPMPGDDKMSAVTV